MFKQKISQEIWEDKYQLKDKKENAVDLTPEDTCDRVAKKLASQEINSEQWYPQFKDLLVGGYFSGGGRIMANIGGEAYKKETSAINCVVSRQIPDSMEGIFECVKEAALVLRSGAGIGYDFSTLRPQGALVEGVGSPTSGMLNFVAVFNTTCSTVLSGGSRRGAQMGALDISHPNIKEFITKKREAGQLRYFNLSVLVSDTFLEAVEADKNWDLWFWVRTDETPDSPMVKVIKKNDIPYAHPEYEYFSFAEDHVECVYSKRKTTDVFRKTVYETLKAKELFKLITKSTYEFNDPGFLLISTINRENNLWFEETIRTTNPCGEIPMAPFSSCLLGSSILCKYAIGIYTDKASFDWDLYKQHIQIATRLLDNVIEIGNLPLPELDERLKYQRRHGMGFTGLGSLLNMIGIPYNSQEALDIAEKITLILAQEGLKANVQLAKEKGPAPFAKTIENRKLFLQSEYIKRLLSTFSEEEANEIVCDIMQYGARFTHHSSLAPTGTMSLTFGNNCSNGLEPVYCPSYFRNIRIPGKKTKTQEEVFDLSFYEWEQLNPGKPLPSTYREVKDLSVDDHINMQAVIQKWIDAACSKTINVPSDMKYEDFKDVYMKAWKAGLKGVTTYRPDPKNAAVLVTREDLANSKYVFTLEDGTSVEVTGLDKVEYDGEIHDGSNLYQSFNENLFGKI